MSLVELLTAVVVVGILAGTSINASRRPLAHQRLLAAARQLELGIEQARDQAMDQQSPCALALGEAGWIEPDGGPLLAGDRRDAPKHRPIAGMEIAELLCNWITTSLLIAAVHHQWLCAWRRHRALSDRWLGPRALCGDQLCQLGNHAPGILILIHRRWWS